MSTLRIELPPDFRLSDTAPIMRAVMEVAHRHGLDIEADGLNITLKRKYVPTVIPFRRTFSKPDTQWPLPAA